MKVYINSDRMGNKRKLVEVELVRDRNTTMWVRLADGSVIKRKKEAR